MAPLRLAFLGSDPIALPLLGWLAGEGREEAQVVGVMTQPDRPAGRGRSFRPNAIKTWALDLGVPLAQPEKLTEDARAGLAAWRPDVALVLAYGHLLSEAFIATPRLGTLNLHASLLPAYRGASPIQSAVAAGERETGMSLMRIVRRLDAGPVADVERVPIAPLETAADVESKLAQACLPLLRRSLPLLRAGRLAFAEQDASRATICRRLEKEDGVLDFGAPAAALAARCNGLFPWPGVRVEAAGLPLQVGLADALPNEGGEAPGTVLGTDAEGLLVRARPGILRLRRLQRPGGRLLPAPDFLRGFPVAPGTVLPSRPMPSWVRPLTA